MALFGNTGFVQAGEGVFPADFCSTYPDASGFERRRLHLMEGAAARPMKAWRIGYFESNDPGKYLQAAAVARFFLNSGVEEVKEYLNDHRSYKEHYHFAAVNWARLLPLFPESLTSETYGKLSKKAENYRSYIQPGGTENHRVMWWASALIMPGVLPGDRFAGTSDREALERAKTLLREYVGGLYEAGQGEWDSSTYLAFDLNGMLNIYDFSGDEECRALAAAALEWYAAGYALKYRSGVYTAPNQRGFASGAVKSNTDYIGWLWWGGAPREQVDASRNAALWTVHAATSNWRPNAITCRIASKDVPGLPLEAVNTKPNYWHGQPKTPAAGSYHERIFISKSYTMGSLLNGHGSQITRFQIVADSPAGGQVFTGGHPRKSDHTGKKTGIGYRDGIGRYDQSYQRGNTFVNLSQVDKGEDADWSFFAFPETTASPQQKGAWWLFQSGECLIGVRPLADRVEQIESGKGIPRHLRFHGDRSGFVVVTGETETYPTVDAFGRYLNEVVAVKVSRNTDPWGVEVAVPESPVISVHYAPESAGNRARVQENQRPVQLSPEPVYNSKLIRLENRVLSVSDGRDRFRVDFSGESPEFFREPNQVNP